jgi:AcrR family transcriptional regulator
MAARKPTVQTAKTRRRVRRGNQEDAEQLRQALITAAMELFTEGGLDAVTIRAVATRAGVATMTPYNYFAGKAELLGSLWESVLAVVYKSVSRKVQKAAPGRARHRAWVSNYIEYWEKNPEHYRLVYVSPSTTRDDASSGFTSVPSYAALVELGRLATRELATELGTDLTHMRLAGHVRLMMQLGYLHGMLTIRRFPWSESGILREAYVDQICATVERILVNGPSAASDAFEAGAAAATAASDDALLELDEG